ncbi:Flp1 family type IVb pilin [Paenibacillus agricola]|nr:Flp1 family type IVb pilin [Paenibacillus agricola]
MMILSRSFKMMQKFWRDEDGLGTLEILLIVAVLVIIAIAFRKWIMKWVLEMFNATQSEVTDQSTTIKGDATSISPK